MRALVLGVRVSIAAAFASTLAASSGCRSSIVAPALAPHAKGWHYAITADPALSSLDVSLCFFGLEAPSPDALAPADDWARDALDAPITRDPDRPECLRYRTRLAELRTPRAHLPSVQRIGRDVVFSPDLFLWAPDERPADARITASFALPAGVRASVPWAATQVADDWVVPETTFAWRTSIALGRFDEWRLETGGVVLDVAVLDRPTRATRAGLARWLEAAVAAVSELPGSIPHARVHVLVVPVAGTRPVEFGMVLRGGGASVIFFVGDEADDAAFPGEWVAVHELTHLMMPFVERRAAWLSEGIATYYQDVLRARAGLMRPDEAWAELHAGFQRGRAGTSTRTLAASTETMNADHGYMRVYWSGAAIALLADVELRARSSTTSLDTCMAALAACCARASDPWPVGQVLEALDAPTGRAVLTELGARWAASREFPGLDATYRALGLVVGADGTLTFDDDAPLAAVRHVIMRPVGSLGATPADRPVGLDALREVQP